MIAASQLSRKIDSREGGRPLLSDLRESGSIEQDADSVLFIHRPNAMKSEASALEKGSTELILAKNRHGPTGVIPARFHESFVRFDQVTDASV